MFSGVRSRGEILGERGFPRDRRFGMFVGKVCAATGESGGELGEVGARWC